MMKTIVTIVAAAALVLSGSVFGDQFKHKVYEKNIIVSTVYDPMTDEVVLSSVVVPMVLKTKDAGLFGKSGFSLSCVAGPMGIVWQLSVPSEYEFTRNIGGANDIMVRFDKNKALKPLKVVARNRSFFMIKLDAEATAQFAQGSKIVVRFYNKDNQEFLLTGDLKGSWDAMQEFGKRCTDGQ